jgi:hypothetical protein
MVRDWNMSALAAALAAACVLSAGPARGDDAGAGADDNAKITITAQSRVGDSYRFDRTREDQMKYTDSAAQTHFTHSIEHNTGSMTITAVTNGIPVACTVTYDPTSTLQTVTEGGATSSAPDALAGKTVTLRLVDDKVLDDLKDDIDDDTRDYLHDILNPDADNFPDQPVSVGQSWECSDKVAKHAELGPDDHILAHVRLDWVKTKDGSHIGQLSFVAADLRHEDAGEESSYEGTGTYLVNIDTGVTKIFPAPAKPGDAPAANPPSGSGFSRDHEDWTPTWVEPTTQPAGK